MLIETDQTGLRKEYIVDRAFLEYTLKEIRNHKGKPYQMANEEYSDALFLHVKQIFPDIQIRVEWVLFG